MPFNPQRKLALPAARPADRTLQGGRLVPGPSKAEQPNASAMAITRMPATEFRIIRLAASLRGSLPSDNGGTPIAS
jgi:hypothetical protein